MNVLSIIKSIVIGMVILLLNFQAIIAACSTGYTRNDLTYWTHGCSVPSNFQSKIDEAIGIWDYHDIYTCTKSAPCPPSAYAFHYNSFTSLGYGPLSGTTTIDFADQGFKIDGAQTYFNSDKNWFDSSIDNEAWPTNWFDRRTVALHEIGHWMYLRHPSECQQNHPDAVMEPTYTTKLDLRSDDIDGLSALGILN